MSDIVISSQARLRHRHSFMSVVNPFILSHQQNRPITGRPIRDSRYSFAGKCATHSCHGERGVRLFSLHVMSEDYDMLCRSLPVRFLHFIYDEAVGKTQDYSLSEAW